MSEQPPAPPAPDAPGASSPAPSSSSSSPSHPVGSLVVNRYFDPYAGAGGEDVEVFGIVIEHTATDVQDAAGNTVTRHGNRVFWLPAAGISDPVDDDELQPVE